MKSLQKYVGMNRKVHLERNFKENHYINGFIHDMSSSLILIQEFYDFFNSGYSISKLSNIIQFRSDLQERFFDKIMNEEGLFSQVKYTREIPLDGIGSVISHFMNTDEIIILECESSSDDIEDRFYMGKVSEIEDTTVWFLAINGYGKWETEEIGIKLNDITYIQFDTPYINIFTKYV